MFLVGTHLEFIFLTLLENSFQVNSFFSHFTDVPYFYLYADL